jgi:hypothetical protein
MHSHDDIKSLHAFLRSTAEGNLKKMLVGGHMSDSHLSILLKVAKTVSAQEFVTHFEALTFPKIKFSAKEVPLKEFCWSVCAEACERVGLLGAHVDRASEPMKKAA